MIQKFSDALLTACPKCGAGVQKLPSAPAIQFKGTGWYITDYARKGASGDGKSSSSSEPGSKDAKSGAKDGASAAAPAASKPDTAAGGSSSK
jgi:predicted nucleic acid-binding Zn ribbon protein